MRVSEAFNLGLNQPVLDFVDVDLDGDIQVFVDPRALLLLPSDWGQSCVSMVQAFFQEVLDRIVAGDHGGANDLLGALSEPNETHLGYSANDSRGTAVGPGKAYDLWEALQQSQAVHTGLVEDLEDTILMVPGVGPDVISDMTTNIIREPLIEYTQDVCNAYNIPLTPDISSGPLWNPSTKKWFNKYVNLPIINGEKIILVPKVIVRRQMNYDVGEYFTHYLLESMQIDELKNGTALVEMLKSGPRVTKKSLKEKYGTGKSVIVEQTLKHPDALRRYREDKKFISPPLDHVDLSQNAATDIPDFDALYKSLIAIPTGAAHANAYEKAVRDLFIPLFYPSLTHPQMQTPLHNGRKRVDITFANVSTEGFFHWISLHYPSSQIFIECKNYSGEISNPELDQLSGRFSPNRGQIGILVCRTFDNKDLFLNKCRDTANDHRGYIIAIDDNDLLILINERKNINDPTNWGLLLERFQKLIN